MNNRLQAVPPPPFGSDRLEDDRESIQMSFQITIALLASFCALGGVYFLVRWSAESLGRLMIEGAAIDQNLTYDRFTNFAKLPRLLGSFSSKGLFRLTLSSYGFVFLPLLRRWEARNVWQFREVLKKIDTQLQGAGIRQYLAPQYFVIFVIFTTLASGMLVALFTLWTGFKPLLLLFGFTVGSICGYFIGKVTFSQTVAERRLLIEKRLPFAVEFMLLAMESGISFPSAMGVYCDEMKNDPLADEFRIVLSDIDRGLSIKESLDNLDERLKLELLSSFLLAVTTGLETGQPVKTILEIQADAIRLKRHQAAEEIAKKASTKAIFPMLLIVLAILFLIIGPLIISSTEMTLF